MTPRISISGMLFIPCVHRTRPLAGGICAECWEERTVSLYQEFMDLKKKTENLTFCSKHMKEAARGTCPFCTGEETEDTRQYITRVVLDLHAALRAQEVAAPGVDPDALLGKSLQDVYKAGEYLLKLADEKDRKDAEKAKKEEAGSE